VSSILPPLQTPEYIADWRNVREPVSAKELRKDKATCELASNMAAGADSLEQKYFVFTDCMRSKGYQPV
jgi:hypothetical protein